MLLGLITSRIDISVTRKTLDRGYIEGRGLDMIEEAAKVQRVCSYEFFVCERFHVHKGDGAKVLVKMKRNSNRNCSGSKQLKLTCFLKPSNSQNDPPLPTQTAMASTSGIVDMTKKLSIQKSTDSNISCDTATEATKMQKSTDTISLPQTSVLQGKRKFQNSWLDYNPQTNTAKCSTCVEFPNLTDSTSKIIKGLSGPFKLESYISINLLNVSN